MQDRRGVIAFLTITFVTTYAIGGLLAVSGQRIGVNPALYGQVAIAATMWVPALAVWVTTRYVTRKRFDFMGPVPDRFGVYVAVAALIPACFAVIYGLTYLFGLGVPDPNMDAFRELVGSASVPTLGGLLVITLLVSPFVNSAFAIGEEIGWRAYLLPKLLPLGKPAAYLITGLVWGLWHAPLVMIGFTYSGPVALGVVCMVGLTTALGAFIGELFLRSRSTYLAAWAHGVFNSQVYGIWRVASRDVHPYLGGYAGLIGIMVWAAVALGAVAFFRAVRLQGEAGPKPVSRAGD